MIPPTSAGEEFIRSLVEAGQGNEIFLPTHGFPVRARHG
jgi:hypothetical protein